MMNRAIVIYRQYAQYIPPSLWLVLLSCRMEYARLLSDTLNAQKGLDLLLPYKEKMQTGNIEPICKLEYFLTLAVLTANTGHRHAAVKILSDATIHCTKALSDDSERMVFYFFNVFPAYIDFIKRLKPKEHFVANLPVYFTPTITE